MANVLDFVEPGPLLSDEVVKPPIVSKAIEMQVPCSEFKSINEWCYYSDKN